MAQTTHMHLWGCAMLIWQKISIARGQKQQHVPSVPLGQETAAGRPNFVRGHQIPASMA